jgi:hypothetical protein
MPTNDFMFLFFYAADRRHERVPRFRVIVGECREGSRNRGIFYQLFRAGDVSSQSKDLLSLLLTQGFSNCSVLDAMFAELVGKIAPRHSETARDFRLRAVGYFERALNHRFFERGQKVAQIVRLGNHLG